MQGAWVWLWSGTKYLPAVWGGQKKSLILSLSQGWKARCSSPITHHLPIQNGNKSLRTGQFSTSWNHPIEYFSIFLSKNKKLLLAYRFGVLLLCFQKKTTKTKAADPRGPGFKARNPSSSLAESELQLQAGHFTMSFFFPLPASINCTLVKWQNVNHLVTKWAPAAIVREWWCWRKRKQRNEVSCQKSTVQRVIWENMTTLQRQGVIMASQ